MRKSWEETTGSWNFDPGKGTDNKNQTCLFMVWTGGSKWLQSIVYGICVLVYVVRGLTTLSVATL